MTINLDKITDQICSVLDQHEIPYKWDIVRNNIVDEWYARKSGLIDLLSRHPNWDEDCLAIVWDLDGFVPPPNTKEAEEDCFARAKKDREQHNDFSQQIPESLLNDGSIKAESKPRQCPILYQWLLDTMLEIIDLWQPTDNIFEIYGRTVYEKVRKEAAAYADAANPLRDNG